MVLGGGACRKGNVLDMKVDFGAIWSNSGGCGVAEAPGRTDSSGRFSGRLLVA